MKRAERSKEAERLWEEGYRLEELGRYDEAVIAYTASARLGETGAQLNLGNLLDDYVTPPRPKEAVYWYRRSVRGGHPSAALNLALHYRKSGPRRWYLHWLQKAAQTGDEDAVEELRAMLRVVDWP